MKNVGKYLLMAALLHLVKRYGVRDMPTIAVKDYGDYQALRLLDALRTVLEITGEQV